jgi:hypothetical protein
MSSVSSALVLPAWQRAAIFVVAVLGKVVLLCAILWLSACSSAPPTPQWQLDVSDSLRRAQGYLLEGRSTTAKQPLADAEIRRLREAAGAAGDPRLLARTELALCAAQAASLDPAGLACPGFERWKTEADAATLAYARYLRGQLSANEAALLPEQHQAAARAIASGALPATTAQAITDPTARLVALSAAFQAKASPPDAIALATSTASEQGWRKALLAWLGVQLQLAHANGDRATAQNLQRRIEAATR